MFKHVNLKGSSLAVLAFAFVLSGMLGAAAPAFAHDNPEGCFETGLGVSLTVFRDGGATTPVGAGTVQPGEEVFYRATLTALGGDNCNFEDGALEIITPDGTPTDVTGGSIPLVEVGSPFVSALVPYIVSEDHVGDQNGLVAPPADNIQAFAEYTGGIAHTGDQHDSVNGDATRNTPYEDVALQVTKTAVVAAEETYEWTITKEVTPATWELFVGDSGTSEYTITLDKSLVGTTYSVSGVISIYNPAEFAVAEVTDVSDVISGVGAVTVTCPEGLAFEVDPDETVDCTYEYDLGVDDTARTNTATVTTSGDVDGGEGEADFDPTSATPSVVGGEVSVDDSYDGGDAGPFSDDASYTYERQFVCGVGDGEYEGTGNVVPNTATIVETQDSDDASVTVNCYDLSVEKTADTTFDRNYDWTVTKVEDDGTTDLVLAEGEPYTLNYTVTADVEGYTDSNHAVSGSITISNSHPTLGAELTGVIDELSLDGAADTLNCPALLVPAAGEIVCTYSSDLADGTEQDNVATATHQNYDYNKDGVPSVAGTTDYEGQKAVTFGDPQNEFDVEVDVEDTYAGFLGTASLGDAPKDFTYEREISFDGEGACDVHLVDNSATITEADSGDFATDDWDVNVTVNCELGCTLTQGYWKTHSQVGPAPYDDNWKNLFETIYDDGDLDNKEEGENFYTSGQTWLEVFWTAPKGGNGYYSLAHQFEAAVLNTLNGATAPEDVEDAIAWSHNFFENNDPNSLVDTSLKGKAKKINKALNMKAKSYASLLASYNEGDIGPGHCDEQVPEEQPVF